MLILILFAFLAGIVTVLSPCILPILPIVLSGSLSGGKKRPLGIVTGFIISFTFFTLLLSSIVKATGIGSETLRYAAIFIIGVFGVSLLIPATQVFLEKLFSKISGFATKLLPANDPNAPLHPDSLADFFAGLPVGLSLGLLWTPCVGPILASVITLALTGSTNLSAFFITLAYSIGTGLPMLAITYGGRTLLQKNRWLLENTAKIQKGFGVVMIAMSVALYFGVDRTIQTAILTAFPQYGTGLTAIEDNRFVQSQLRRIRGDGEAPVRNANPSVLPKLGTAPNPTFEGATKWINSEPLSFDGNLKGKVVLVDFWTYTCINCIRTFPYITSWHEKYKDKGLVIIGVHSPEFEFEKVEKNVVKAMQDFKIEYPVLQDNDFLIWRSYKNQYWPAHYLFDSTGQLRATHFGEGGYQETEAQIQLLLKEAGEQDIPTETIRIEEESNPSIIRTRLTPETYLGLPRGQNSYTDTMTPRVGANVGKQTVYTFSDPLAADESGLKGRWLIDGERVESGSDTSTLSLNFTAGKVFLVMGGRNEDNIPVTVKVDGKDVDSSMITKDFTQSGGISVTEDRKYDILDFKGKSGRRTVELTIPTGISAYAFTFGE